MRPNYSIDSKIRVTDKNSELYRCRGKVIELRIPEDDSGEIVYVCKVHRSGENTSYTAELTEKQFDGIQKKFIDIEHIREADIDLGNGVIRKGNTEAFEVGDIIQISEKIDGANASICYNADDDVLEVFSRTNILNQADGLRGFKSFIETKFTKENFKDVPNYVIFGEWCVSHHCQYDKEWYNVWRVYDIWDKSIRNYLPQSVVKEFCEKHNIEYIHALYEGPFVSWEHCRSFMNKKTYGKDQEGIVVKNQTKLNRDDIRAAKYLKIVNDSFKECMTSKSKEKKVISPEELAEKKLAFDTIRTIVTEARVRKLILKLVDEGVLSTDLKPSDMGIVCKRVPKMIWDDILKEESEIVKTAGALAGNASSQITIELCRKIIIGK